jgi:hypothetical protein
MPLRENSEVSNKKSKRIEIKNSSTLPSLRRRPFKRLKRLREPREEEKLLSYSNIINNQLMIKKHMKNWLMSSSNKKQKDNTK